MFDDFINPKKLLINLAIIAVVVFIQTIWRQRVELAYSIGLLIGSVLQRRRLRRATKVFQASVNRQLPSKESLTVDYRELD